MSYLDQPCFSWLHTIPSKLSLSLHENIQYQGTLYILSCHTPFLYSLWLFWGEFIQTDWEFTFKLSWNWYCYVFSMFFCLFSIFINSCILIYFKVSIHCSCSYWCSNCPIFSQCDLSSSWLLDHFDITLLVLDSFLAFWYDKIFQAHLAYFFTKAKH